MHQRSGSGIRQGESEVTGERRERLELSVPQVAGSALAAVAAAVLASRLGVYGTIVGAGVVSVIATCGGPVFQHLFRRTGEQIREVTVQAKPGGRQLPVRDDGPGHPPLPDGEFGAATTHGTRVRGWKRPLRAAVVVFVLAMVGITGFELAAGRDLSGSGGTTVGYVVRGGGGDSAPSKDPANSPDPAGDPSGTPDGRPSDGAGGTDPGRSPGTGPSTDTDPGRGGGTDPSPTPSGTPSATPSGSGGSGPGPTPSGSTGTSDTGTNDTGTRDTGTGGSGTGGSGTAGR
ncbi:hypothetical protein ACFRCX_10680 [Streptomyces sp. NPDC056652]|uniref:hypothetical protein n=1 Tax=Streptomyces sp. NPDC056652 TaxID=3345893 RepID=UPI003698E0F1